MYIHEFIIQNTNKLYKNYIVNNCGMLDIYVDS